MSEVHGKAVKVAKFFQAQCRICPWTGLPCETYQDANEERRAHLDEHRAQEVSE